MNNYRSILLPLLIFILYAGVSPLAGIAMPQSGDAYKEELLELAARSALEISNEASRIAVQEQIILTVASTGKETLLRRQLRDYEGTRPNAEMVLLAARCGSDYGQLELSRSLIKGTAWSVEKLDTLHHSVRACGHFEAEGKQFFDFAMELVQNATTFRMMVEHPVEDRNFSVEFDDHAKAQFLEELRFAYACSLIDAGHLNSPFLSKVKFEQGLLCDAFRVHQLRIVSLDDTISEVLDIESLHCMRAARRIMAVRSAHQKDINGTLEILDGAKDSRFEYLTIFRLLEIPTDLPVWTNALKQRVAQRLFDLFLNHQVATETLPYEPEKGFYTWSSRDTILRSLSEYPVVKQTRSRQSQGNLYVVDYPQDVVRLPKTSEVLEAVIQLGLARNGSELAGRIRDYTVRGEWMGSVISRQIAAGNWEIAESLFEAMDRDARASYATPSAFLIQLVRAMAQRREYDLALNYIDRIADKNPEANGVKLVPSRQMAFLILGGFQMDQGNTELAKKTIESTRLEFVEQLEAIDKPHRVLWLFDQAMNMGWRMGRKPTSNPLETEIVRQIARANTPVETLQLARRYLGSFTPPNDSSRKIFESVLDGVKEYEPEEAVFNKSEPVMKELESLASEDCETILKTRLPEILATITTVSDTDERHRFAKQVATRLAHLGYQKGVDETISVIADPYDRADAMCVCAEVFPPASVMNRAAKPGSLNYWQYRDSRFRQRPGGVF